MLRSLVGSEMCIRDRSTPELCSGVHQKGCDLEGVEGATPPTPNHSLKTMTTFNTDYSNAELLDQELSFDELQEINGGVAPLVVAGFAAGSALVGFVSGIL